MVCNALFSICFKANQNNRYQTYGFPGEQISMQLVTGISLRKISPKHKSRKNGKITIYEFQEYLSVIRRKDFKGSR